MWSQLWAFPQSVVINQYTPALPNYMLAVRDFKNHESQMGRDRPVGYLQ
mgnify:CR=1 FL=1